MKAKTYSSLRLRIMVPPLLLLLLLLGSLALFGSSWVEDIASDVAKARADATALSLAHSVELLHALSREQPERVNHLLSRALDNDPYLAYVVLAAAGPGGRVYVSIRSDEEGKQISKNLSSLEQLHAALHGPVVRSVGGVNLVIMRQRLPEQILGTSGPATPSSPAGASGPVGAAGAAAGSPDPSAAAGVAAEISRSPGDLFVGVSLSRQGAEYRSNLWSLITFLGVAVLCYALAMIYLMGGFTRRMEQLAQGARRIEEGDLSARLGSMTSDELGVVGRAFDAAVERLAQAMHQMHGTSTLLVRSAREVGETATSLRRGASTQVNDADHALQSVREVITSLSGAVKQSEMVRDETRLSAGMTARLATVSQEAATAVEELERVAGATVESVRQIAGSSNEVAGRAARLSDTTTATAGAVVELKQSIGRVRETAMEAAKLAEEAGGDAERGNLVLSESLAGIEHIRSASRSILSVTGNLQLRVSEIGDVLHLITELTQRTNLLALNASIIAAQAGAEGRGFAVVADEIKDLARRTANSAGSIDSLIQAVAEGAHEAGKAARTGGEAVDAGVAQAREAARTMTDILSRLRAWSAMAKSIANATDEQVRGSSQVTRSIQEVQQGVADIAVKSAEQARRGEYLQRQTARLQEVVEILASAAQEQREGTAQVADTLARLARTVEEMSGDQRSRVADGERVRGLLDVVRRIASGHREAAATLDRAVSELRGQATLLDDELSRGRGRGKPDDE